MYSVKKLNQFVTGAIRGTPEEIQRIQDLLAHWLDSSRTVRYQGKLVTPIRKGPRKKVYQDDVEVHLRRLAIFEHVARHGKEAPRAELEKTTAPTPLEQAAVEGGFYGSDGMIYYCHKVSGIISHRFVEVRSVEAVLYKRCIE